MATGWTRDAAAHLLRRATWGGTPEEVDRALADGLEATVDRLINDAVIDDRDAETKLQAYDTTDPATLARWWVARLILSRRGLRERMVFFLHDHFATGIRKVKEPSLMKQQNELFRRMAFGSFTDLTIEVSRDPAMLIWLDNFRSRKESPNENYGRELLELFTLGHGNYTEEDVVSAARAFTGWSLSRQTNQFQFVPAWHDDGVKTFLGHTGNWNGDDIVRFACSESAHAQFLTSKLFEYFVGFAPSTATRDRLASTYASGGTALAPLVRGILTSDEMFSTASYWQRVRTPLEHCVIAARQLGYERDPRFMLLALRDQGLIPFNPPDVDGWPSGLTWVNSASIFSRMNMAGALSAQLQVSAARAASSGDAVIDHYAARLGPLTLSESSRSALRSWIAPSGTPVPEREAGLVQIMLSLPELQKV